VVAYRKVIASNISPESRDLAKLGKSQLGSNLVRELFKL